MEPSSRDQKCERFWTLPTNPGRGLIEREIHLRNGSKLFRQTEPLLTRLEIFYRSFNTLKTGTLSTIGTITPTSILGPMPLLIYCIPKRIQSCFNDTLCRWMVWPKSSLKLL